jgi:tetratricopeptide (TPR) repeat protein
MRSVLPALPALLLLLAACGDGQPESSALEEARLLRQAGEYTHSLMRYEEALQDRDSVPELRLEYAETAVLASQAERGRMFRQKAKEALLSLEEAPDATDSTVRAELWRRLGWEMARDRDSLQAYRAFDMAMRLSDQVARTFEEEWLLRGAYAGSHTGYVSGTPDSILGTDRADSMLAASAESHLLELGRISRTRTDLRVRILRARAKLLPYTDRRDEELSVLTELDRMGEIGPANRQRRMDLLLELARKDMEAGRPVLAREKLLEVWSSDFVGEQVEAAVLLGELAASAGDTGDALTWYRRACNASPALSTHWSQVAASRRDSLLYLVGPE